MKKLLAIIILGFIFSECTANYGPMNAFGGYESVRISENTHRVSFAGQGHTNWESVKAYAKLRGGDLASQNGFDYVKFKDSEYFGGNGITYTVRMFKFSRNLNIKKDGKTVCKIESAGKDRSEAIEYVREKLLSCTSGNWYIVEDIPKFYGYLVK